MKEVFLVGFKKKEWRHFPHDYSIYEYDSKDEAMMVRESMQNHGFVQVFIKKRRRKKCL